MISHSGVFHRQPKRIPKLNKRSRNFFFFFFQGEKNVGFLTRKAKLGRNLIINEALSRLILILFIYLFIYFHILGNCHLLSLKAGGTIFFYIV